MNLKLFFNDYWQLLFKGAAENHLRIQACKRNPGEGDQCQLEFSSFSSLKRYQKKVRIVTFSTSSTIAAVFVAMFVLQFFFTTNKSLGATFAWIQTSWDANPTVGATAAHNLGQGGNVSVSAYESKDANLVVQSPAPADSSLTLSTTAGQVTQTDDTATNVGFNLSGAALSNAVVGGTGAGASVKLASATTNINSWDMGLKEIPGNFSSGGSALRNGADDTVYVVLGNGAGFYKYSIAGNSWTTLAPLPAAVSYGSVAIRNGGDNDIYVLQGYGGTGFYKYSISGNSWTTLTVVPGAVGYGSAMLRNGADDAIYVSQGNSSTGFYKYSIAGNSWTTLTAVPGVVAIGGNAVRSGGADELYVTQGGGATGFYKYSISGNSWTTLTVAPGLISNGSIVIHSDTDDAIYVSQGNSGTGFYKYSISGNSWITLTVVPGVVSNGGNMIRNGMDNDIYLVQGGNATGFYKYSISGNSWTTVAASPAAVGSGGLMIRNGADNDIYLISGNNTTSLNKYSISGNSWIGSTVSNLAPIPGTINIGSNAIRNGVDDEIYVTRGNNTTDFYKYSVAGNSWVTLAPVPAAVGDSAKLFRNGADNDIYLMRGSNTSNFYKYSISGNSWTTLTSLPTVARWGGTMIRNGADDDIYATVGNNSTAFYKYSIAGNSWTTLAAAPGGFNYGHVLIRNGADDTIYVTRGAQATDFYKYSISGNSWTTLTAAPGLIYSGGLTIRNGGDNDIYVMQGNGGTGFYKYSISGNSWTTLTAVPGAVNTGSAMVRSGADNDIYVMRGNATAAFYKYSISGNSWTTLSSIPAMVNSGATMLISSSGAKNEIYAIPGNTTTSFYRFIISNTIYSSAGTYTSGAVDMGRNVSSFGNVAWTQSGGQTITLKARSSASANFSGATAWGICANITNGQTLATGNCVTNGHRYIQYQIALSTANMTVSPSFDDITLNFAYYPTNQTLVSATYDTSSDANAMGAVSWTEDPTLPSGTGTTLSLRTGATALATASSTWTDINTASCMKNSSTGAVTCPNNLLPTSLRDNLNDRFFQYKVTLASGGDNKPTVNDVQVQYIVNAPPEVQGVTAAQGTDGKVTVNYQVRDIDTNTGATPGKVNIPALEYCSANCATSGSETWTQAASVTGQTANLVVSQSTFNAYQLVWDPKVDYNNNYTPNIKIRVKADDSEQSNRYGYGISGSFILDTKNPSNVSLTIDHSKNQIALSTPSDDSAYQFAVSNLSDLSDATYQTFPGATYVYSNITNDPATVYVRIKDVYGNYTTAQAVTPAKPQHIVYYDVSNTIVNDYREFIAWDVISALQSGSGFSAYKIYRSTDNVAFSLVGTVNDRNTNYFLDTNLSQGVHYYYKIQAVDTNGDISQFSSTVDDTPDGQGGTDQTPPTISAVQVANISTTSATVTWTTDELADSSVGFSADATYLPERGIASVVTSHSITLTGLTPNATYNVRIKSRDVAGNLAQNDKDNPGSSQIPNYTFTTLPGPAISNVTIPEVSNNQATIAWKTTTNSSTYVLYSDTLSNGALLNPVEIGTPDLAGGNAPYTHSQQIAGLVSGKQYYFETKSVDAANNVAIDNNGATFYSFTTTTDTEPPVITASSQNPLVLTDVQAALSFGTSEKAIDRLGYKKTGDIAFVYADWDTTYNTDHMSVLSGLEKKTDYDFVFEAKDVNGNFASSPVYHFTTKESQMNHPDLINPGNPTNANELLITDNQALISFKTNTDSKAKLCLATSPISDKAFSDCLGNLNPSGITLLEDTDATTDHTFALSTLDPDKQYTYRIYTEDSLDPKINFSSGSKSFTTKKTQVDQHGSLSSISTPGDNDIVTATNFAFISWTTDQLANSYLGCSTVKDDKNFPQIFNQDLVDYQASHTLKLLNLTADTTYYCKVVSADNLSPSTTKTSDQFSFTTQKDASVNHDPLKTITFAAQNPAVLTDTDAVISFATDQEANCFVEYGATPGKYDGIPVKEIKDAYNDNHSLHLMGLLFSTKYFYKVTCQDNLKTVISSDEKDFTTMEQLFTKSGAEGLLTHKVPPVISNVKVTSVAGESATVTWATDENANCALRYGTTSLMTDVAGKGDINADPSKFMTQHEVTVYNLVPSTLYYFAIVSQDASGNIAQSPTNQFTTASPSSISSIKAESKALGEGTITWQTDAPTTSLVEYGLTTSYGEKKENTSSSTDHSIVLANLNQGVVYHYRVKGTDSAGRLYASADQTFQPKSPPQISAVAVNDLNEHGATVSFKTSVPTSGNVIYTDAENKDNTNSQGKVELSTEHNIVLQNLDSGKTYQLKVDVRDEQGTESQLDGSDFTTTKDENPPKIDNVKTDSALTQSDKVQTIISWKTDEQATTSVLYREGKSGDEKEIKITDNLTTGHIAVITTFKPGTVYEFKVKSIDASGNEAVSNDFALLTPRKRENIIQIIIGNFTDIFGWAKFN